MWQLYGAGYEIGRLAVPRQGATARFDHETAKSDCGILVLRSHSRKSSPGERMAWRELYNYWQGVQNEGRPPHRADIDPPLQIPRLLPNLMLIDAVDGYFQMRLVGSEVSRRAGRDPTGLRLDPRVITDRGIPAFVGFLRKTVETRRPVIYSVERGEQTAFGAIGLLLPLSGPNHEITMILGGLFYDTSRTRQLSADWTPGTLTELSLEDMLGAQPP
jgi:hypothetical protein